MTKRGSNANENKALLARIERADLIILLVTSGDREDYGRGFDLAQEYFQDYAQTTDVPR